ncbi:MAG: Xaa-Pro peptidase family protein [Acidimicrobiia bacterium]
MAGSKELISALTPMKVSGRVNRLRDVLPSEVDSIIVSNLVNIRYLTGFTGSNALAYISREDFILITDGRYEVQSSEQLRENDIDARIEITVQGNSPIEIISKYINQNENIALESNEITWASANNFIEKISRANFVPQSNLIEALRKVKEKEEIDRIRVACRIADEALEKTIPLLKDFPSEKEFAKQLDRAMVDNGAQGNSFDTITACGARAALPHAFPTDSKIQPNQMIVIDFGCIYDGYCSDMTRTISVGEVDDRQNELWQNVIDAQQMGVDYVKEGVLTSEIDSTCRTYLDQKSLADKFTHSTGHGVGLNVHEEPWVRSVEGVEVVAGNILTVEPGVYIEGFAGVRIEDTLAVEKDGAESLTSFPKFLSV